MEIELTLQSKVMKELTWDPNLDASQIEVATADSVITLTGNVRTHAHKLAAERAAKRVTSLHVLANDLQVRPPVSSQRKYTEIAPAVAAAWFGLGLNVVQDDPEVSH
jgi:hypothetical protein